MAHVYRPGERAPVKPPPRQMDPATVGHDMSIMEGLSKSMFDALVPSMPTMKWMADAALTLGGEAAETAEFAMKAAPYAFEAAEMLAPLAIFLNEPPRVSA